MINTSFPLVPEKTLHRSGTGADRIALKSLFFEAERSHLRGRSGSIFAARLREKPRHRALHLMIDNGSLFRNHAPGKLQDYLPF
jgi:hypothetical protein